MYENVLYVRGFRRGSKFLIYLMCTSVTGDFKVTEISIAG